MEQKKVITITTKEGETITWDANKGTWDEYVFNGRALIIKLNGAGVGIYNLDVIAHVTIQ